MDWKVVQASELAPDRTAPGRAYREFLRSASLSAGLYELPAGGADTQSPHGQDEVYFVLEGEAILRAGGETAPVRPGSIVFVRAGVRHRFERIGKDLRLLVVFAPPEG